MFYIQNFWIDYANNKCMSTRNAVYWIKRNNKTNTKENDKYEIYASVITMLII